MLSVLRSSGVSPQLPDSYAGRTRTDRAIAAAFSYRDARISMEVHLVLGDL